MAKPARRWPNVEKQVAVWLTAATGRPVFTETTSNLTDHLPAYKVTRVGGGDGLELDRAIQVEVESLASTRAGMWEAVQAAETAMAGLAANGTPDWYVDDVTETFSAAVQETDNDGVRKASATYALTLRPQ